MSKSSESTALGSVIFGSTWFRPGLEGSSTSEPLSLVPGSDGVDIFLSSGVEGFGVLLGSFARTPDAGAATAVTEAVGWTRVTRGVRISAGFKVLGGSTPLNKAAGMMQPDFDHSGRRELRRRGGERTGR